jgi:holo-[acyl-carrier protein] synthase
MPILGIGTDLLHLPRLSKILINRPPLRLAQRICSAEELLYFKEVLESRERTEAFLALRSVHSFSSLSSLRRKSSPSLLFLCWSHRWTAKEAAYKALYPHFRPTWKDLEVFKVDKKPFLRFSPAFLEKDDEGEGGVKKGEVRMHLSVSHDAGVMGAFVVVETRE